MNGLETTEKQQGVSQDLRIERRDSVIAVVTLKRPERRNALNLALWRNLEATCRALGEDGDVRAVILTGAGGNFCSGADISEFSSVRANREMGEAYERDVEAAYEALTDLPKPVVAAVAGHAVGGGCALAMACDFRVAAHSASFAIPAARLGIVYSPRECRMLETLVGLPNAKRILFSGQPVKAEAALAMGLVDQLTDANPVDAAIELAGMMAGNAPIAIAGMKLTLNAIAHGRLEERQAEIQEITGRAFNSEDYREGAQAFLEKRRPNFAGR